ncbi:MAG: hypothetical protein KDB23_17305 [Planctomycetales bacterium]|nr:hypothetical protein [Planctomycetales bacterium]
MSPTSQAGSSIETVYNLAAVEEKWDKVEAFISRREEVARIEATMSFLANAAAPDEDIQSLSEYLTSRYGRDVDSETGP